MKFKEGSALYETEIERHEGENLLYINYLNAGYVPSIATHPDVMSRTVDALIRQPQISRIIFVQPRNYHYPHKQVQLLIEVAQLYTYLTKTEEILSPTKLALLGNAADIHGDLSYLLSLLKQDPIGCYYETSSRITGLREQLKTGQVTQKGALMNYVRLLERVKDSLEGLKIIRNTMNLMEDYVLGERELYKEEFRPDILPNFTFTRLVAQLPKDATLMDTYQIGTEEEKVTVTILKKEYDTKYYYHIMPPEYTLKDDHHILLNLARNMLSEHRPKSEEFTDPERTRNVFYNISRDLLTELSRSQGIVLSHKELKRLSQILVRHTIGFGLIEILLMDEKLQDILLNAPIAQNPIFVRHSQYEECVTNIIPSYEDGESWAAKLRLQSGRPLDEANPVLDTDLAFRSGRARVAAVTKPLSPQGLTYAFRRHRDDPWTLPLFIENKMINSFGAGLLSFFIDGSRTLLVAGTRSSGKTSLLGSLMLEIMPKYRILTVEDTLELPTDALREIGYDILRLQVSSALSSTSKESGAADGIRTSLRLGDSALIVGEVRSTEAKALYEAMRVGALANTVAGTIHGDSPYGVFDRVVNDLGVPPTSFKATDLIIITSPVRSADGLHTKKRVMSITEVRKHWKDDPGIEQGFVDLMRYNVENDELEPTPELINGDSELIKQIAGKVKEWAGNWEAVYDNIILRGKLKQTIVEHAKQTGKPQLLEARFNTRANDAMHKISQEVSQETGTQNSQLIQERYEAWIKQEAKKY